MTGSAQLTFDLPSDVTRAPRHSLQRHDSALFEWQWHGRQMFMELRNDFRFPRKLHRVVYHLSDACEAPDEATARAHFQAAYPDAQTTGFFCNGPVKQPNKRRKTPNDPDQRPAAKTP